MVRNCIAVGSVNLSDKGSKGRIERQVIFQNTCDDPLSPDYMPRTCIKSRKVKKNSGNICRRKNIHSSRLEIPEEMLRDDDALLIPLQSFN